MMGSIRQLRQPATITNENKFSKFKIKNLNNKNSSLGQPPSSPSTLSSSPSLFSAFFTYNFIRNGRDSKRLDVPFARIFNMNSTQIIYRLYYYIRTHIISSNYTYKAGSKCNNKRGVNTIYTEYIYTYAHIRMYHIGHIASVHKMG